jgi:uncharacterized protein YwgA
MAKKATKPKREDIVLAALASGRFDQFSPVQVQKMFFLIDRNVGEQLGGPYFNFVPYDYGPFDAEVYEEIKKLSDDDFITINGYGSLRRYTLTEQGHEKGKSILERFPEVVQKYMSEVSKFVQKHSFTTLVAAIYKDYPEMKVNSVFRS